MVGDRILHYEVIELLGRGAMGSVYKALDTRLDTFRTLKFLNLGLRDLESAQEHLVREAKTQAQFIHPNIATLLALEIVGDQAFLVIEYIDGNPLHIYLEEQQPALKDRLMLLLPVANALGAAHQQDIIHRDIKPSNILVGRDGAVKVTDFGLAKAIGHTELSKTGETKGSVLYMPPEAFRGERVRETADVWALGVVCYEVLEGHAPFEGESFEAIGYRILREEHAQPTEKVSQTLPGIEGFLDGCLEKDAEKRIQNGQEAFQRLQGIAEQAGIAYVPQVIRPARFLTRPRSKGNRFARFGIPLLLALAAVVVFLIRGSPEQIRSIPILQSEDFPVLNHSGTHLAYLIGDYPQRTMAIRELSADAGPEFHTLPENFRASAVNWARDDSLIVLSGQSGVILYHLGKRDWRQIIDYWARDPCWCMDGQSLLWSNESGRLDQLEIATDIGWPDEGEELNPVINPVPVEGLPPPLDGLGIYNPVFGLDDTRIFFVLYRMATNIGIWSVPRSGGQAIRAISGEDINVWKSQWDERRGELLCLEHGGKQRLMRLKVGRRSALVRRTRQVRFPADVAESITDFCYRPVSGRYVIRTVEEHSYLWSSPIPLEDRGFSILISRFDQILTPSISPDQSELLFVAADVDEGVLVQVRDLMTGDIQPLHPPTGDYGSENHPQIDPVNGRYVIFTGRPDAGNAVICYLDRHETRIRTLDVKSENGNITNPFWSTDGTRIYYRIVPVDRTDPSHLCRIHIQRTDRLRSAGRPDTLYSGHEIPFLLPGPDDGHAICQRGLGSAATLVVMDLESGEIHDLTAGEKPALSPSREDVFFQSGNGIFRVRDWLHVFDQGAVPELIVEYPPGVADMAIGPCLAVSDDSLFAVLSYKGSGELKVYQTP